MRSQTIGRLIAKAVALSVAIAAVGLMGCSAIQRKLLFYPSHRPGDGGLTPWRMDGRLIGFARITSGPKNVWLMLHGNGGQAIDRVYAIGAFSPDDSVFILEYPGYGERGGTSSRESFDAAAIEAYLELRRRFPAIPICVAGESIGSGPASMLAKQPVAPDKIVLVVPFDTLKSVASEHAPFLPTSLILGKSWDNFTALSVYKGPIEILAQSRTP